MKCMCAISINVTGFIGEVRFTLGSQAWHKGPLLPGRQWMCEGRSRTGELPRGTSLQSFTQHSADVCQLQRGCHIGRFRSRLGERTMGPSSSQILSTQHAHNSGQPQPWKAVVGEPTWSVKSLLALGQWSAQSHYAHICHTGVVTLSENFMLRLGKAVNILSIVTCTNA